MLCGIYKIWNLLNRHKYIGSSNNCSKRRNRHFKDLLNQKHHCLPLQRAYDKYGQENLIFEMIEYCEESQLIEREQYFIDSLNPEYNLMRVAKSCLGYKHTVATRNLQSEMRKGKFSGEQNPFFGKKHTEESLQKMKEARKKQQFSQETIDKRAASNRGRKRTEETKNKMHLANQINRPITIKYCQICGRQAKKYISKAGNFTGFAKTCDDQKCKETFQYNKQQSSKC